MIETTETHNGAPMHENCKRNVQQLLKSEFEAYTIGGWDKEMTFDEYLALRIMARKDVIDGTEAALETVTAERDNLREQLKTQQASHDESRQWFLLELAGVIGWTQEARGASKAWKRAAKMYRRNAHDYASTSIATPTVNIAIGQDGD